MHPRSDPPVPGTALVLRPDTFTSLAGIVRDLRAQHRKAAAAVVEIAEELRAAEDKLNEYVANATRI